MRQQRSTKRAGLAWLATLLVVSALLGGALAYRVGLAGPSRDVAKLAVLVPVSDTPSAAADSMSQMPARAAATEISHRIFTASTPTPPPPTPPSPSAAFAPRENPALGAYPAIGFGVVTPAPAMSSVGMPTGTPDTQPPTAVAALTLDQKIGQMMMFGFRGTDPTDVINDFVKGRSVGNIVLLGDNITAPAQLSKLDSTLQQAVRDASGGIGGIISVDQEGGTVERLAPPEFQGLPSARRMAATGDPARVTAMATEAGAQLSANGINMDLAPVFDVNDNPANPVIGDRAFGIDPTTVIAFAPAFTRGLHASHVASVAKHFPGHGNTSEDSHLTLPYVTKTDGQLRTVELPPFASAINARVDAVMVDHVVYTAWDPNHPASLSSRIITGILRDELGYDGVVMTDDMNMQAIQEHYGPGEAAVLAILAGDDVILTGGPPELEAASMDGVRAAVLSGRIPMSRIDQSVARILALKRRLGLFSAP